MSPSARQAQTVICLSILDVRGESRHKSTPLAPRELFDKWSIALVTLLILIQTQYYVRA
jgi:hypothetical protein